jgi:hypothetical protein
MNNDNYYIKWYRELHKPHIKTRKAYVASDEKYHKMPVEPKPASPARCKMTHIEKARRKIERNLDRIEARRQAWHEQNKSASIINENTTLDAQGQETDGDIQ